MEEYLTVDELCQKIKYSRQSIYNMINRKTFKLNQHYYKPSTKKILFIWSAIQEWLAGENTEIQHQNNINDVQNTPTTSTKKPLVNNINI
jgi:predicted DNA-binding transcriptional regulator AlpA